MLKEEPRIFKLYSANLSFLMFIRLECAVEQFLSCFVWIVFHVMSPILMNILTY